MTFAQSVKICLGRKYLFKFRGRASRSEFWWFMLFIFCVNAAAGFILRLLPVTVAASISLAISLLLFPANIGVSVRRFHDRNLSGWWILIPIVMLFLWILSGSKEMGRVNSALALCMCLCYLAIFCMPGTPGDNKYGPPPQDALKNPDL